MRKEKLDFIRIKLLVRLIQHQNHAGIIKEIKKKMIR